MPLRSRRYSFYVLGLLGFVNLLNYANRNVVFPNRFYEDVDGAFSLSNAELGLLGTAFMGAHALFTLPAGWLGDRFDRRRVMAIGIVVWSCAALVGALATGLGSLLLARAVQGIGCAACVPVANALLCEVFPPEDKARTVSFFNLGLFLGGIVGFLVGTLYGFPLGLVIVAAPGFAAALLVHRLDLPPQRSRRARGEPLGLRAFAGDAASTFRLPAMRWMYLGAALMAFAAGGYLGWFTNFLEMAKGMSREASLGLMVLALVSGLFGVMAGGVVGDRLQRRRRDGRQLATAVGLGAAVPCALVALHIDAGPVFYVSACLLIFFVTWYHGPMAAAVDDLAHPDTAATAQGTYIFLMHLFGTTPSTYVVGILTDEFGVARALLAPTAAMLLAAVFFLVSGRSLRRGPGGGAVLKSEPG